jgi:hypothetical protein
MRVNLSAPLSTPIDNPQNEIDLGERAHLRDDTFGVLSEAE